MTSSSEIDEWAPYHTFVTTCECFECHKQITGNLVVSKRLRVVDSPGFMIFNDGIICERCMALRGMPDPTQKV